MQKHRATRMHYDFRLEWGGVLRSWAVPKGFSADPKDKHLAIHVEDHPVDYADFEGVIPQGNYGAGAVIVWDRGTWVPLEDPEAGWRKGKLLFSLSGHKLRGVWTLFRIKSKDGADNVWLMMKKPDAGGNTVAGGTYPEHSVLSGLLVEERADAAKRAEKALARLRILGAPQRKVSAKDVQLMLATPADGHFEKKGFWFEPKYDGFRVLLERVDGRVRIRYRHGQDATAIFPEVAAALSVLPFEQFILDAEIVVLDENRKPSFQRLQKRAQLKRPTDVSRAAVENVATCFVFDLLALESFDLRPLALRARKEILESILPALGVLRVTPHFSLPGERVFEHATRLGFEGVVGKRTDSPYRGGRSRDWLKHRALQTGDFAVVGFTEPRGSRSGLGALHLATFDAGRFLYGGAVGTGFTEKALRALRTQLEPDVRATPPCQGAAPKGRGHRWVKPRLVAEVRFVEWTKDGVLRQPAFVRLRDDKLPKECTGERPLLEPPPVPETSSREKRVAFTHLDKLFWPAEGLRKGDLIDYYRSIAPWMLPYLRDRPLVLTRFPDGISGKSFFQKDAPGFAPDWIRLAPIWSESAQRESRHIVADDVETLLYVANSAAIPIHLWASRVASLQKPDWMILDLDPKEAPFAHVVELAQAAHELCEEIGLPCYVKTTGSSGLHVLVPLGAKHTYDEQKSLGELLARVISARHSRISTLMRDPARRGGKVYLDYLQNGYGKLMVAPFSVRPLPTAPISMPLLWREVNKKLSPRQFTIQNAVSRMKRLKEDAMRAVLSDAPDLAKALKRLERVLAGAKTPARR